MSDYKDFPDDSIWDEPDFSDAYGSGDVFPEDFGSFDESDTNDLSEEELYGNESYDEESYGEELYNPDDDPDWENDPDDEDLFDLYGGPNGENGEDSDVGEPLGHRDRIRLRIAEAGVDGTQPLHLLEFLLYYVLPRQDVQAVAKAMMEQFGSLRHLFRATLTDFRQVKGLGENGAQWMDKFSRLIRKFIRTASWDYAVVENTRDLVRHARQYQLLADTPLCMQMITDKNDLVVMRSVVCEGLHWADLPAMRLAVEDASAAFAKNAYMMVFTPDHRAHPNAYDDAAIQEYARQMKHANCALRDVVFISKTGCTSMFRLNRIPGANPVFNIYRSIAEDEMERLLSREPKIIQSSRKEKYDHSEPV